MSKAKRIAQGNRRLKGVIGDEAWATLTRGREAAWPLTTAHAVSVLEATRYVRNMRRAVVFREDD